MAAPPTSVLGSPLNVPQSAIHLQLLSQMWQVHRVWAAQLARCPIVRILIFSSFLVLLSRDGSVTQMSPGQPPWKGCAQSCWGFWNAECWACDKNQQQIASRQGAPGQRTVGTRVSPGSSTLRGPRVTGSQQLWWVLGAFCPHHRTTRWGDCMVGCRDPGLGHGTRWPSGGLLSHMGPVTSDPMLCPPSRALTEPP